tara:strand:- start:16 stop:348 length:333 start_codon:yes stop_codon:yes gene_type:complete
MANTYSWKIQAMNVDASDGFAHTAHYTVTGISDKTDSDGIAYNDGAYGDIRLERPESLVPFNDLPKEDVVAAVKAALGADKVAEIENALAARIAEKITPTQFTGLPSSWS